MKLEVLEKAARECGKLILGLREEGLGTENKQGEEQGYDFFTEADTKSQELGIKIIRGKFADETIIAEEQKNEDKLPTDYTAFDPIDGTLVYYNGGREFSVTLGTVRDGQPVFGVTYFPADDVLFSGQRGKGVTMNGKALPKLTWDRPLNKTMIGTDLFPWADRDILDGLLKDGFSIRSINAGTYGARAVLLQETGAYYHVNAAMVWDGVAGALMVEELGGVVCGPQGKPLTWDSLELDYTFAANQDLADAVLKHTKNWPGRG